MKKYIDYIISFFLLLATLCSCSAAEVPPLKLGLPREEISYFAALAAERSTADFEIVQYDSESELRTALEAGEVDAALLPAGEQDLAPAAQISHLDLVVMQKKHAEAPAHSRVCLPTALEGSDEETMLKVLLDAAEVDYSLSYAEDSAKELFDRNADYVALPADLAADAYVKYGKKISTAFRTAAQWHRFLNEQCPAGYCLYLRSGFPEEQQGELESLLHTCKATEHFAKNSTNKTALLVVDSGFSDDLAHTRKYLSHSPYAYAEGETLELALSSRRMLSESPEAFTRKAQ